MALTDTAIRAAKPKDKPYKLSDSAGLYLMVNPTGSRLWRLKYRLAGKEKVLAIGAYPAVSLATAREKREQAKALLAQGTDPSEAKQEAKREAVEESANTFRLIAEEYLAKARRENRAPSTMAKNEWLLGLANDEIGDKPIREISAAMILDCLRTAERRGRLVTAKRLRAIIGAVFRYAIYTTRAEVDPTSALKGALTTSTTKHHAAILDPIKFGGLLRAIDACDGQPTTKAALQLMSLVIPRTGDLRMAEWREFDLDKAIWTIPAARAKTRREHTTPLPPQAVAILRDLHRITGNGRLVFPSVRTVIRPISENTINAALRRFGYTKDEMTGHGFRATASTLLNESGLWHEDAIERQLSHVEKNDVRRAYARGEHWDERVRMLAWWADHLDGLRKGETVIALDSSKRPA